VAVRVQLKRIEAAQEATLALTPEALRAAQRLAEFVGDARDDLESLFLLGWFHYYRGRALGRGRGEDSLHQAIKLFTLCYLGGDGPMPEPLLPLIANEAAGAVIARMHVMKSWDPDSIREIESSWRRIVRIMPNDAPLRAFCLSLFSVILQMRSERTGSLAALDEAVAVGRVAMRAILPGSPEQAGTLSNVGAALFERFKQTGAAADLEEAVTVFRAAIRTASDNPGADHGRCLNSLGNALLLRFEHTGVLGDLDEAVAVGRAAVQATSPEHSNYARSLINLGSALRWRFERTGALATLDEAISIAREAVRAISPDNPKRRQYLGSLVVLLQTRFERTGALVDLDEAVSLGRDTVRDISPDDPDRAACLGNLALVLQMRFDWYGALADLDEAIAARRAALLATPAGHVDQGGQLSMLGIALRARFERADALADLDEAVAVSREAVQGTPSGHQGRALFLSNLGLAAQRRFERSGALADLEEAISTRRAALVEMPSDNPNRGLLLSNLALALWLRFKRLAVASDLDEAINSLQEAARITPADYPRRALILGDLALRLASRFDRSGMPADLDELIASGVQAVEMTSAQPSERLRAARLVVRSVAKRDISRAADLAETAVRLLPETASRRLERGDQQHALGLHAGLAGDAASLALADETTPGGEAAVRALRLLELGRGVLLSQALDTRGDLTDLAACDPALAERFAMLRDRLDQETGTAAVFSDAGAAAAQGAHQIKDRQRLAVEFETTLAEIRGRDGFGTFLLPAEPKQLVQHARHGPVAVVNVSEYRGDAILVRPEGVSAIPLPELTEDALRDRLGAFQQALQTAHDPTLGPVQQSGAQDSVHEVLEWLWDAVAGPILDVLGYRHTPVPRVDWPRVWWVPGGLLGLLPLHAAGYHRDSPGHADRQQTVMDRVVSSYTPTVRALGYARERDCAPDRDQRAVIVAMPTTPGMPHPLHHVAEEAELVQARFADSTLLSEKPTKAAVLARLNDCAIAHFACHGSSHPEDPSRSLLLLHDHNSDPLTVASLAPIRLDHARLAYLSACRTAFNPEVRLVDEAIHLTTAFQLVGYPHVVGTLWEVDDALAVRVADAFYAALLTDDGTIDTRDAARALHHAVRAIRDELFRAPSLWAGYLHAGA